MIRSFKTAIAVLALAIVPTVTLADEWANVKVQVVWAGPGTKPRKLDVNKDQAACLAKGDLHSDELIIDPKTMGVKNVMVWLAPEPKSKLAIHPDLTAVPKDEVVIDQPMCMFEPRITMMREGQTLVIKNSANILHNAKVIGDPKINSTFSLAIPAGQSIKKMLKAEKKPMLLACDVHGWMAGRLGVFDHPYYGLTKADGTLEIKNAPVGKCRLFVQHEVVGWLHKKPAVGKLSDGEPIEITAGGKILDVIKMKPPEE